MGSSLGQPVLGSGRRWRESAAEPKPGHQLPLGEVARTLPTRAEVDKRFTWDAQSVFPDAAAWEAAVETVLARLPDLAEFKGHLGASPEMLADWFDATERVQRLFGKATVSRPMSYQVDVGDQAAVARTDRTRTATARLGAAMSFAMPEMIAIGFPKLREWVVASPRLAHLGHYFDRLERLQAHLRSPEVEEILTQVSDPLASAISAHSVLANADMKFPPAIVPERPEAVAQGTIGSLLNSPDPAIRRTAYESSADAPLALQNTMATSLAAGIKRDVFYARARGYRSSLHAALEPAFIPLEVFHNIIQAFSDNVGTWHRYWRLRRRVQGGDKLKAYDTRAPLQSTRLQVPYEQAGGWVSAGSVPRGAELARG